MDTIDKIDYTQLVSTHRKAHRKVGTPKKSSRKKAYRRSVAGGMTIMERPASAKKGAAAYQGVLEVPAVEKGGHTQTTVSVRQASDGEIAALEISNIKREFTIRKALLKHALPVNEVCELLGIKSRQTLHNWITQGKIIALPDNGRVLLPLWQFEARADDKVVTGFSQALRALKRRSFSAAHWFTNPNVHLGNKKPIALLRAGEISKVIAEAELVDNVS